MTTTSPAHIKAQHRLVELLQPHYTITRIEMEIPVPNQKYVYDNEGEFVIKPYKLDVYAYFPKTLCDCKYRQIGIEVDGKKGHKTSKHQKIRDEQRTLAIQQMYKDLTIFRFDTKDLIGRGYVNPKTKKRHPILTDDEILAELGVKCTHV
jgi:hypothetical protein